MSDRGPVILTVGSDRISLEFESQSNTVVTWSDFHAVSEYYRWERDFNPKAEATYARLTDNAAFRVAVHRHEALMLSPYQYAVRFSVVTSGWPLPCLALEDACTPAESWGAGGPRVLVYNMKTNEITPSPIEFDPLGNLQPYYHTIEVGDHLLPTFPLWPGLLADSGLFAGAWAVLIFTPLRVRRWLRARRSGCPHCGYSPEGLKEGAACPECGRGA